ncbi:hypothetical protein NECID01_0018 [Nematocida sp. AWRm77]|nr:hypothetical protein NECID01_0018 [Nematocida sp. AWRm77]
MDGPRLLKLKLAFEKMLEQIFKEIHTEDAALKEELLSSFTQILLKYSIPSKLNELDARLAKPASTLYDVTEDSSIRQILASYAQASTQSLLQSLSEEEEKVKKETARVQEEALAAEQAVSACSEEIKKWMGETQQAISDIKKQTQ